MDHFPKHDCENDEMLVYLFRTEHPNRKDELNEVVARSEVELVINDPVTGERIIRNRETNLGDFCADAYRAVLNADIGMVNGGGIRAALKPGEITYGDLLLSTPMAI